MKKVLGLRIGYILVALTVMMGLLLSACGDAVGSGGSSFGTGNSTAVSQNQNNAPAGDGKIAGTCDGKGEVSGQILVMTETNQDLKNAPVTLKLTAGGQSDPRTYTTEPDGTYTINDLDVNEYEVEASLPSGLDGKIIEPRKKYLTIDDCYVETVSMVLLAQGINPPPAPEPSSQPQQIVYVNNQPHYSITHNPFFWLWLFDRPHYYGYSYPPVYTTRIYNNNNYIYVPQARPNLPDTRYKYTSYADSGSNTPGVKAAPPPVSKGSTRIGSSGYTKPPAFSTPRSGSSSSSSANNNSGSKGSTRSNGSSGAKTPASGSSSVSHPSGSGNNSSNGGSSYVPHPSGSNSNSGNSSKSSGGSSSKSSGGGSSKGGTRPKR